MKCTGETNLEGLFHPSKYKAQFNEREELMSIAWEISGPAMTKMKDKGWSADLKGIPSNQYKGGNIYLYLMDLAITVRNYIKETNELFTKCNSIEAEQKYSLDCVEDNLMCLGKQYGTDYRGAWDEIMKTFGIDRLNINCDRCCEGIGEMIINSDKCNSFIVGPCEL